MEIHNKQRPLFITMICSFYFIYWAISIIGLIAALLINIGPQFPALSQIANQINLIFIGTQVSVSLITWLIAAGIIAGIIGYWLFQKWAVIVYVASSIALAIVVLSTVPVTSTTIAHIGTLLFVAISVFAVNIAMIVLGIINFKWMK